MHENTRINPENWQAVAHLLPQTALELAAVIGIVGGFGGRVAQRVKYRGEGLVCHYFFS